MPVVRYAREQQGYRVFSNPSKALHGLGQFSQQSVTAYVAPYRDPNCAVGMPFDTNGDLCPGADPNCANLMPYDVNGNPCPGSTPPVQPSGTGVPTTPGPTVVAPQQAGPSTPAGVPTGSVLIYQATLSSILHSASAVVSGMVGSLAPNGLQVVGQSTGSASGIGNFTVQLQLQVTGAGFARPQDVQAIADHAAYAQTGNMPLASQIAIVSTPSTAGASLPPGTFGSTFSTLNWNTVLIGVAAIVAGTIVLRKIF